MYFCENQMRYRRSIYTIKNFTVGSMAVITDIIIFNWSSNPLKCFLPVTWTANTPFLCKEFILENWTIFLGRNSITKYAMITETVWRAGMFLTFPVWSLTMFRVWEKNCIGDHAQQKTTFWFCKPICCEVELDCRGHRTSLNPFITPAWLKELPATSPLLSSFFQLILKIVFV